MTKEDEIEKLKNDLGFEDGDDGYLYALLLPEEAREALRICNILTCEVREVNVHEYEASVRIS